MEIDARTFLRNGTKIVTDDGEYTIESAISMGGSGLVYCAWHENSRMRFAIKEAFPYHAMDKLVRMGNGIIAAKTGTPKAQKEAEICLKDAWKELERESVVGQKIADQTERVEGSWKSVHGLTLQQPGEEKVDISGIPFIVMNYMRGKYASISDFQAEAAKEKENRSSVRTGGNMSIHTAASIMVQALRALYGVHKSGYIHGDIQPGNLLFVDADVENGDVGFGKIIDFSASRELNADGKTSSVSSLIPTTVEYAAPELLNRKSAISLTPAVDIYSMGAIFLYDLLGHDRHDQSRRISFAEIIRIGGTQEQQQKINQILAQVLTEDPAERYADNNVNPAKEDLGKTISNHGPERFVARMLADFVGLARITQPARCVADSNYTTCPNFIEHSRDKELKRIAKEFLQNKKPVWIWGLGGIGKSELAIEYMKTVPVAFRVVYQGTMRKTILGIQFNGYRYGWNKKLTAEENEEADYQQRLGMLRDYNSNALMVIDNFYVEGRNLAELRREKEYKDVISLNLQLLITTRYAVSGEEDTELKELSDSNVLELYRKWNQREKANDEDILELIHAVDSHTLTVVLMAETIKDSMGTITVQNMLEEFKSHGFINDKYNEVVSPKDREERQETINQHLKILWKIADLPTNQKDIMAHASLIPEIGFKAELFYLTEDKAHQKALNALIKSNWLQWREDKIFIHPCVRELVRKQTIYLQYFINEDCTSVFIDSIENEILNKLQYSTILLEKLKCDRHISSQKKGHFSEKDIKNDISVLKSMNELLDDIYRAYDVVESYLNVIGVLYFYKSTLIEKVKSIDEKLEVTEKQIEEKASHIERSSLKLNNISFKIYVSLRVELQEIIYEQMIHKQQRLGKTNCRFTNQILEYGNFLVYNCMLQGKSLDNVNKKEVMQSLKAIDGSWTLEKYPELKEKYDELKCRIYCTSENEYHKKELVADQRMLEYALQYLEILKNTCADGNIIAETYNNVGYVYGKLGEIIQALFYYKKSSEMGSTTGMHNLAWCYLYGNGCEMDCDKAIELFTKAAEDNTDPNSTANLFLGKIYLGHEGEGIPNDLEKALHYLLRAKELGEPDCDDLIAEAKSRIN